MVVGHLGEGLDGCQEDSGAASKGVLQLANVLQTLQSRCSLVVQQVGLGQQPQHLYTAISLAIFDLMGSALQLQRLVRWPRLSQQGITRERTCHRVQHSSLTQSEMTHSP